jgi:ABC-2 type transport system ATP-binding protein
MVPALSDLTVDIHQGEFFGFLGQNGAGKTTLFKILSTLVVPDEGAAIVGGYDVVRDSSAVRHLLTPVIAEERSLFWRLSAFENLRLFAELYGLHGEPARQRVRQVLDTVRLVETGEKLVGAFSSGMKQRLLIGRALLAQSRILLLDEPTRSLDPVAARDFRRFLRQQLVNTHGYTILLATHSADEALELCDRVSVLHQGQLLAVGTVQELKRRVGTDTYRIVGDHSVLDQLATLQAAGRIDRFRAGGEQVEGWVQADLQFAGGKAEAAAILKHLVSNGSAVSEFDRSDLTLADLLERILAEAGHA